jgi:PAS domain S-box-containing protein
MPSSSSATRIQKRKARLKAGGLAGLTIAYVLFFPVMHRTLGQGSSAVSLLLVGLAAWLYGLRAGLLAGGLAIAMNTALLMRLGEPVLALMRSGGVAGYGALLAAGGVTGYMSDLHRKLARELVKREALEKALVWEGILDAGVAELSSALVSSAPLEEISALVLEQGQRLTDSALGFVGYIDRKTGDLIAPTMTPSVRDACQLEDKTAVFHEFRGLWGWVLTQRQPLLTNSPRDDPRSLGNPQGHLAIDRFLSAPAMLGDELVGQIALANASRDYEERDLEVLQRMAKLFALAIARRRDEEGLHASELRFRQLFMQTPIAKVVYDIQSRLVDANTAALELFGVAKLDDVKGMSLAETPYITAEQREVLAQGGTVHVELLIDVERFRQLGLYEPTKPAIIYADALISPFGAGEGYMVHIQDITARRRAEQEREQVIAQLQEALANVKTLSGLVPICASCKKIRDDQGYWQQVEHYVAEHSQAEFTHGICPDCMRRLYPDYYTAPNESNPAQSTP